MTNSKITLSQNYIFKIIKEYLDGKYGMLPLTPSSNWIKDLGLSEFDRATFFEWIEQKFQIKLPYFYFDNFETLCRVIAKKINKKTNCFQNFIQTIKQRLK